MQDNAYQVIRALLASNHPDEIQKGLQIVADEIIKIGSAEAKPLFEMVTTLFYIDALDRPELVPILEEAVNLTAGFGSWVIPALIESLDAGDIKSQWAIAHVLGRIGADAIGPMLKAYEASDKATFRAFILYAMGKIKSPEIVRAAPIALEAARSDELELRDTAVRAMGKMIESIPPRKLSLELKESFAHCLHARLSDESASVRSKAVRSLGKMARHGHLDATEIARLKAACGSILGTEKGEWDRAFIVRKEAEEAMGYLQ
jgi:HEAT repeat protein